MSIFQRAYDAIKNWQPPAWVKALLQELNDLMLGILKSVGQDYINFLTEQIIAASQDPNMSAGEKFEFVFKQAKKHTVDFMIVIKDRELNCIIEFLYAKLRASGAIK